MSQKVTIDVEARFVDNITDESRAASKAVEGIGKEADKAQKQVDKLSKKKATPIFDADNNKFLNKIRSMEAKMTQLGHKKTAAVLDVVDKATTKIGNVMNKGQQFASKVWQSTLKFKDSDAWSYIKKVTDGLNNVTRKTWSAMVKVKDMALAPINAIKNALFSIPTLITAIVSAKIVKSSIIDPINLADQYTGAYIGFKTLLGESEAQAMMDEIDLFAKKTPFKTSGVISNVQKMMAYGWDVDRVIEDMETIGDAAAATGKGDQGLESIVRALAEIRSKGKLSTQELNQLAGAGIKAKAYLAEGLGYGSSDAGMMKLAKDLEGGAIGANQAIDLILQGMKEFDGMMDATANEKVEGLMSQLEDAFEINIARKWGQGLQDGAKRGLGTIVSLLDEADESLAAVGDTLYELGQTAANWVADKLEGVAKRIKEITDTYEFKNASLSDKISMLWNGVVVDPMKEWWEGGGREKVTKTAENIGKWLGEALLKGLSFAWNALPWWGKLLVGAQAVSGIGNMVGNIGSLFTSAKGFIGATGNAMVGGSGLLGKLANIGYGLTGGAANAAGYFGVAGGLSGGLAAGAGAGALTMVAGGVKSIGDFVDAYKAHKAGDKITSKANIASGSTTLAGMGIGAAIGSAIVPGVGTLIGGGIGTLAGWIGGNAWAKNIQKSRYETETMKNALDDSEMSAKEFAEHFEKAKYEKAVEAFGKIKLSAEEINRLVSQLVWGDDELKYWENFQSATKNVEANLQSLKTASQDIDRWMWKAGLGVKFNQDEKEAFVASVGDYITSATSLLQNKHYQFSTNMGLLLDPESDISKTIIKDGDAYFKEQQDNLDKLTADLADKVQSALEDGVISTDPVTLPDGTIKLSEQAEIENLQKQITDIITEAANQEFEADIKVLKAKWGGGNLDKDSYDAFITEGTEALTGKMDAADTILRQGYLDIGKLYEEGSPAYQAAETAIKNGYQKMLSNAINSLASEELGVLMEAATSKIGTLGASKLGAVLEHAINTNTNPVDIPIERLVKITGTPMSPEYAGFIKDSLQGIYDQIKLVNVDGKLLIDFSVLTNPALGSMVVNAVEGTIPNPFNTTVNLTAQPGQINPFTVNPGKLVNMTGTTVFPTINLSPRLGNVSPLYFNSSAVPVIKKYRGGIVGGSSAMEGFARGGIVGGSTRFIRVNEESPEMIIPLSSQRRERAMKLWTKTGNLLGVPGFARGGMTSGGQDEGIRFKSYGSNESVGGQPVQVDIGGLTFEINVNGSDAQSITQAIKEQAEEIAEVVAGVLADALGSQFENTPARGGVA